MEDLTNGGSESPRRQSAAEVVGGLASALKAKLQKGNKAPPTPPKKDFLTDDEMEADTWDAQTNDSITDKPDRQKPKSAMLTVPGKPAVKKSPDRNLQPPPPAPPVKTSDPKPVLPVLPGKPTTDAKPVPPLAGNKPSTKAVKPALPVADDTNKPDTPCKPKPPVKSKFTDSDSEGKVNVAGLADALKAKFDVKEQDKPAVTQKPNTNPKPVPGFSKKPIHGAPTVPVKPGMAQKPQPPSKHPQNLSKPSWVKDEADGKKENSQGENTGKVSDLASVLKAKFESRQSAADISTNDTVSKTDNKPVIKAALKPADKPAKPSPPTQKKLSTSTTAALTVGGVGERSSSPVVCRSRSPAAKSKRFDPEKYSSRPLPPSPKNKQPERPKPMKKPLPTVPAKPGKAISNSSKSSDSSDTDSDTQAHVSNIANALKARLADAGTKNAVKPQNDAVVKPKLKDNQAKQDRDNNNSKTVEDTGNMYRAIADFDGFNDGEMKLVAEQEVELLETADEWSFVCSGGSEGWVPSTYIEKALPVSNREPVQTASAAFKPKSKQPVFRTCSDFTAENEGELSVSSGQEVKVLEQPEGGWWFVQSGRQEGWVPASYLTHC